MEALQAKRLYKEMEDFCSYKLRVLLNFNEVSDITARILELPVPETQDFIRGYINADKSRYKQVNSFIVELLSMKRKYNALLEKDGSRRRVVAPVPLEPGTKVYVKERDNNVPPGIKKKKNQREKRQEKKQRQMENKETKFVRKYCDCQALVHRLIGNCLKCGKIICEMEGEGDCMFCGAKEALMAEQQGDAIKKATAHRDKLLKFDANTRSNKVYDDQSDHFDYQGNQWLSPQEKELLKKREEDSDAKIKADQRKIVITLDLAGRRIVQEEQTYPQPLSTESEETAGGEDASSTASDGVSLSFANESDYHRTEFEEEDPFSIVEETGRKSGAYKNPFLRGKAPTFRKSNSKKPKQKQSTSRKSVK